MKPLIALLIILGVTGVSHISAQVFRGGVYGSVDYTFRVIEQNTFVTPEEFPIWGYTAGIAIEGQKSKRFWMQGGFYFTNKGYTSRERPAYSIEFSTLRYTANYYQAGLSYTGQYYVFNKNLRLFVGAGVGLNRVLGARQDSVLTRADGSTVQRISHKNPDWGRMPLTALANTGLEKDFGAITLRLYCAFSYAFTEYEHISSKHSVWPYSRGIGVGVYKKLNFNTE